MNLSAYDVVENKYMTGSWIDPNYKKLYSKEIEYHPYYAFFKRYNNKLKVNDYFITLVDNEIPNVTCHSVIRTNKGLIKIDLAPIWNTTNLKNIIEKTIISLEIKDKSDDGVVYYLDV